MLVKKIAITAAAGAIVLASAASAFASHHSSSNKCAGSGSCGGSYTKTEVTVANTAEVSNYVGTFANSGLNYTSTEGGDTKSGGSSKHHHNSGGSATGGDTKSVVVTGDAGAESDVTNVVNSTYMSF